MSESLERNSTVNIVWIADDDLTAEALRIFFPMHLEHMKQHAKDGHSNYYNTQFKRAPNGVV